MCDHLLSQDTLAELQLLKLLLLLPVCTADRELGT